MCMTVETLPCEAGENVHVETFNVDIVLQIQETILARHNFEFDILNRLITKQNRISKCECIFLALVMGRPTCMKRSPYLTPTSFVHGASNHRLILLFISTDLSAHVLLKISPPALGFHHFSLLSHIPLIIFLRAFRLLASSSASALSVSTCLMRHIDLRTCM